jgi:hypothetical protein
VIKVRIGRPISVAEQNEYKTIGAYSEFLRKKTYMLANPYKESKLLTSHFKNPRSPKEIATPLMEKMIAEVDALRNTDCRLAKQKLRGLLKPIKYQTFSMK